MIVVVGSPIGRMVDDAIVAGGIVARIALAGAAKGSPIQVVGRTGDDSTADAVVLDLARNGVGHAALLRDPARPTALEPITPEGAVDEATDDEPLEDDVPDAPSQRAERDDRGSPTLDAGDVDLGLRYLTDFSVVVLAESPTPEVLAIVGDATRWAGAKLIVIIANGAEVPATLPTDAIALEAPASDPDDAFATLVGAFAAALDAGVGPREAFEAAVLSSGWTGAQAT